MLLYNFYVIFFVLENNILLPTQMIDLLKFCLRKI